MTVRAKFKVSRIECQSHMARKPGGTANEYERTEMRTIVLSPVYSDDPESENRKFWNASPSGEIKLGTINPQAWAAFELDGEYYIDFTKA
jgi:hypothetical protein